MPVPDQLLQEIEMLVANGEEPSPKIIGQLVQALSDGGAYEEAVATTGFMVEQGYREEALQNAGNLERAMLSTTSALQRLNEIGERLARDEQTMFQLDDPSLPSRNIAALRDLRPILSYHE